MVLLYSSDYWKQRWERTGQYLFARKLVKEDILNARYRYGTGIDEKMVAFVNGLFPKEFSFDQFWAAVGSKENDMYNGEWSSNLGIGYEFKKHKLIQFYMNCEDDRFIDQAKIELLNFGLRPATKIPELPKMNKIEKKIKDTKGD